MTSPRAIALEALIRIDRDGAFANIVVPSLLDRSDLSRRDRAFVTELVYGTTRMRRACDWLVDRFIMRDPDPVGRAVLRLGAYQLVFLDTPPHAAVAETVEAAPRKVRGFANAVLRKVALAPRDWSDDATRLSYPDWIIRRLREDLGDKDAIDALEMMNRPARATEREDGYIQDLASTWIADAVGVEPSMVVMDMCAAPGGKATRMASTGARVIATDNRVARVGLIKENAKRTAGQSIAICVADGTHPPFRSSVFDRVVVDAPCSGLGTLRRRPDARWRIDEADIDRLAELQRQLVDAAVTLVKPGGWLVYSVCTLTRAETSDIADYLGERHPSMRPLEVPSGAWVPHGRGGRVLPHNADTDGMYVLRLEKASN